MRPAPRFHEIYFEFATSATTEQCAKTFEDTVSAHYTPGRRLMRLSTELRGNDVGGLEFFTPRDAEYVMLRKIALGGPQLAWYQGAQMPCMNAVRRGITRVGAIIAVIDEGELRHIHLLGLYELGNKGTAQRLLDAIKRGFESGGFELYVRTGFPGNAPQGEMPTT